MLANTLIFVVAAIHIYILILEMFLWESPTGRKAFGLSASFARETRVMQPIRACITVFWPRVCCGDSGVQRADLSLKRSF